MGSMQEVWVRFCAMYGTHRKRAAHLPIPTPCQVVLDMLHKNAVANAEASSRGGVVLGVTSPEGPTATLDVVIGQVGSKAKRAVT